MTYKGELAAAMAMLADDDAVRFVGYGLKRGRCGGTLPLLEDGRIVETTVAENLMVGVATGLSLCGKKPVVYVERFDFILNALDAVVNHLDKLAKLSDGQFRPAAILRVVVGNRAKPLFTGATHTQDFTEALRLMVSFPVVRLERAEDIMPAYLAAKQGLDLGRSTMLVELKDML